VQPDGLSIVLILRGDAAPLVDPLVKVVRSNECHQACAGARNPNDRKAFSINPPADRLDGHAAEAGDLVEPQEDSDTNVRRLRLIQPAVETTNLFTPIPARHDPTLALR